VTLDGLTIKMYWGNLGKDPYDSFTLVVVVAHLGGGLSAREDLRLGGTLQLPK